MRSSLASDPVSPTDPVVESHLDGRGEGARVERTYLAWRGSPRRERDSDLAAYRIALSHDQRAARPLREEPTGVVLPAISAPAG